MNRLKIFAVIGMIIALCSNFVWAGSIEIVEIDADRNALVDVTLCGGGTIDDPKVVSSDDTLYILFSASEIEEGACETSQESIPIPPCSEDSKIVALLYSEITTPEGSSKDWSIDSLYVDLDVDIKGCCQEKYEACIAECDGTAECEATCLENLDQCLITEVPEITVDCKPERLNLKSKGNYVTCYLMSSDVDGIYDIDTSMLQLHYAGASLDAVRFEFEEDLLMVKFDRQKLQALIKVTETQFPVTIELSVSGEQNGKAFEVTDSMRVKWPKKKKKKR